MGTVALPHEEIAFGGVVREFDGAFVGALRSTGVPGAREEVGSGGMVRLVIGEAVGNIGGEAGEGRLGVRRARRPRPHG